MPLHMPQGDFSLSGLAGKEDAGPLGLPPQDRRSGRLPRIQGTTEERTLRAGGPRWWMLLRSGQGWGDTSEASFPRWSGE